jgi:hypothetical protein
VGEWRQHVTSSQILQPLHRLGSNNAARRFFETRNHLANFFTTNEGSVPGQDNYVTRGAKRIKIY